MWLGIWPIATMGCDSVTHDAASFGHKQATMHVFVVTDRDDIEPFVGLVLIESDGKFGCVDRAGLASAIRHGGVVRGSCAAVSVRPTED
jgi:hypothetical protein